MFTKILVPLDGSELAEEAVGRAASIARASGAKVDLLFVHQPPLIIDPDPTWTEKQIAAEDAYLEQIAVEIASGGGVSATRAVVHGDPATCIADRAKDLGVDLIVMTSHGRGGLSRAWLGSVADVVVRHSRVPVLTLRPVQTKKDRRAATKPFRKILVPVDGSELSREVLGAAIDLAKSSRAAVVLLRVVEPVVLVSTLVDGTLPYPPMLIDDPATEGLVAAANRELDTVVEAVKAQGISSVERFVIVSPAVALTITDFARGHGIDALAMSTHGRGKSRLFLGSVADKVRRSVDVPVMLHRPASRQAPNVAFDESAVASELPALSAAAG